MKVGRVVSWGEVGSKLRSQFIAGVVVFVPLAITIGILYWMFTAVDTYLQPIIQPFLGRRIPGLGLGVTLILIYIVGVIASNVFGKRMISYGDSLMARVPLIRSLYSGSKQLLEGFSTSSKSRFSQTVLIEFPRKGVWTMGFITNELVTASGERRYNIFLPTVPNPLSGFLLIMREDEVVRTDVPVDEALKVIISAGRAYVPEVWEKFSEKMTVE